jgi:hypothetical protein
LAPNDSITHRVVLNDGSLDTGNLDPGASSQPMAINTAGPVSLFDPAVDGRHHRPGHGGAVAYLLNVQVDDAGACAPSDALGLHHTTATRQRRTFE